MFIDTHLHLSDKKFDADRDAVIQRALDSGVTRWIEIAESPESWDAALAMAERYPHVYASLGIHPHHAHLYKRDTWPALSARLRDVCAQPKVVAIGEFGLDYFRMQNTREEQHDLFRRQLELARELEKPVVIHCREGERTDAISAHGDIQKTLAEFYPETSVAVHVDRPAGVIHCFSGLWSDAQVYMHHGFMLGVDAPVTYPSSKLLQENVRRIPLERLVLETDSPYLPPQTHRGQRNEPAYLPAIAEYIAELKHVSVGMVAERTAHNARSLFRMTT